MDTAHDAKHNTSFVKHGAASVEHGDVWLTVEPGHLVFINKFTLSSDSVKCCKIDRKEFHSDPKQTAKAAQDEIFFNDQFSHLISTQ